MRSSLVESALYSPVTRKSERQKASYEQMSERTPYLLMKRAMDVVASLLVILLIYPLFFPLLALVIKLTSRGPVFFKQKRAGLGNRTFWCYKFRTMYVNDAADSRRASRNDPRVTRVGYFLRNTCLDELPQFLNVLRGDMSIVGPRPHMLKDIREFSSVIDNYTFRSLVRPGITGLSQVRGYRGPATTFHSIFRRYQWDAYYVRNVSLRLDCKIMAKTVVLMFSSFFNKDKPVPVDSPVFRQQAQSVAKKIA
ncbi:MAG: sugar transferase [Chitinophagaceae bacterium]|nr:sugar transferase [Chitinophagaceae bacterium]